MWSQEKEFEGKKKGRRSKKKKGKRAHDSSPVLFLCTGKTESLLFCFTVKIKQVCIVT